MSARVAFRSAFFGTPEFAVPALSALHELSRVVGVVCQPDRPAGRGMKLRPAPVKERAIELGLPVFQPTRVRSGELESWLRELNVDVALVAAYGRILPKGVLAAPRLGCVNLHASILPAYRGAAPIQWAIMQGENETGISLMQMDEGMDTGAVYAVRRLPIPEGANAGQLTASLADLASDMVRHELLVLLSGQLSAVPQEDRLATSAPPISRQHAMIDWSRSNIEIFNQVRAMAPSPGAFTFAGPRRMKVLEARVGSSDTRGTAGEVLVAGPLSVEVACGIGSLVLVRGQAEGRNVQTAQDLVNGRALELGQRLAAEPRDARPMLE
jgi:methionyl-tRNA formyltransferase